MVRNVYQCCAHSVVRGKECPDIRGELSGRLQRGKVTAAREHGPVLNVVLGGRPAARRAVDLCGEYRRAGRHLQCQASPPFNRLTPLPCA